MLAKSLRQSIVQIENYQKENPSTYNCMKADLDCLRQHIDLVVRYLSPMTEEDLCISLPRTLNEVKSTLPAEV